MKLQPLVTKDSLRDMLNDSRKEFVAAVIGKALVRIFERQTASEQNTMATNQDNGIGFTGADAFGGSITAKYFIKHGTLLGWQVARWTKLVKDGYPRICKYHRQLNEIALQKQGNKT
jgi:hypothetical protein